MRSSIYLLLLIPLSGCGSIFDPAPYAPFNDTTLKASDGSDISASEVLNFTNLDDAYSKLYAMQVGYNNEANEISRQQYVFDIPAIGLGVASLASLSFHGAANVTTGLGFGAGAIYGSKTYFEPSVKINAYSSASQSLLCAAISAKSLSSAENIYGSSASILQSQLTVDIQTASDLLGGNTTATLTSAQKTALLSARDVAQKALTDTTTALNVISSADSKLQSFALATVSKATTTIRNGTPDPTAVLKSIQAGIMPAAPPSSNQTTKAPAPGANEQPQKISVSEADATNLAGILTTEATNSEIDVKAINDAWSTFSTCTTSN